MDGAPHGVPVRVAEASGRIGHGGSRVARCSADTELEAGRRAGISGRAPAFDMYDRVCEARVLGEVDAELLDFAKAVGEPKETAWDLLTYLLTSVSSRTSG